MPRKLITTSLDLCDQSKLQPSWFDGLSDDALVRLERIIKTRGNSHPLVDASRSTTYVYANLLGCEAGRIIYDGDCFIASEGRVVALGRRR